jgi:hypothetical protein
MDIFSAILSIAAGLVLLFAGRRLFWLAAALVAFLFTFSLFDILFGGGWFGLIVALIVGGIFAWLAVRFVRLVGYIIAALAGAAGLPMLFSMLGIQWSWFLLALIGAVIGILVIAFAYDWGLIILTAWIGANSVANNVTSWLKFGSLLGTIIFLILLVAGIGVQAAQLRGTD